MRSLVPAKRAQKREISNRPLSRSSYSFLQQWQSPAVDNTILLNSGKVRQCVQERMTSTRVESITHFQCEDIAGDEMEKDMNAHVMK